MKKRVLVIEHDERIAVPLVEQIGWDPNLTAVHCGSIDDVINEAQQPFDMAIVEIIMSTENTLLTPEEQVEIRKFKGFNTGIVLLKRLMEKKQEVPILFYTTLNWNSDWKKEFGEASYIKKPAKFETIKSEIDKFLDLN